MFLLAIFPVSAPLNIHVPPCYSPLFLLLLLFMFKLVFKINIPAPHSTQVPACNIGYNVIAPLTIHVPACYPG